MTESKQTSVNRFQSRQYHCVACGFRTSEGMFDKQTAENGDQQIVCPECGSDEVLDADTRERINPA